MQIRPARPEDAAAVADVHVRAWRAGYRDLLPADFLAALDPAERAARYTFGATDPQAPHTVVATIDTLIAGFASIRMPPDTDCGELCALYVAPERWNTGLGRALIAAARQRLVAAGCRRAQVWILAGNVRAERFYRRDGWRPDGGARRETVWGAAVEERRLIAALP